MPAGGEVVQPNAVAITMVKDEATFLPIWRAYYGGAFGEQNLVVIDDQTTDGSTDDLPGSVLRLPPYAVGTEARGTLMGFAARRARLVNRLAHTLRTYYEVVIYTDVDEFIVPNPDKYDGLADYVARVTDPVVAPVGLNLLHVRTREPAYDPSRPILQQRRYVKFTSRMCKPVITREDAVWSPGFHGSAQPFRIDPDLVLLHTKFFDFDFVVGNQRKRNELFAEGRGGRHSTWGVPVSDIEAQFDDWAASAKDAVELDMSGIDLDIVEPVQRKGRIEYEGRGDNQRRTMRRGQLNLLPSWLGSQF